MKKINLLEILKKHSNICIDDYEDVKNAMKEACKQSLELAAENASCNHDFDGAHGCEYSVDKQSILDTINQIE